MRKHVIILGGGVSGLSAAWRLAESGVNVDVLESTLSIGGAAGTVREGGYCLDIGPHSFFSHDPLIVDTVCGLFKSTLKPIPRTVKFCYKGKYLDYPLTAYGVLCQMGVWSGVKAACSFLKSRICSIAGRRAAEGDESVEDWAIANFGGYLYRTFFKPYTEQFWKVPCSELSARSIPTHTRMSFTNTLKLLLHRKTGTKGASLIEREMCPTYYPDTGFAEIAEQIAARIENKGGAVHRGAEVSGVTELPDGRMRVVYLCNGQRREMEGDYVISTLPLPVLAHMLSPALPSEALVSADKLEYRALVVLGMLTQKQNILNCGYVYLLNRPFNRIFEMNEFSVRTSPPGENIIAVEIPCLRNSAIWSATKEELFSMCIPSLAEEGYIGPGDVERLFVAKAPYAYPIYRKGYAAHLALLSEHLGKYKSLSTLGRCGEFMYMDIDECMKRAFDLADDHLRKNGEND